MTTGEKLDALLLTNEPEECYAVPGSDTLIDMIDPATGLTCIYKRTLDDVQREYPHAERTTYTAWALAKAERQSAPFTWEPSTREKFYEMLEVLPPALMLGGGFLVGEPWDHETLTGRPRFQAFRRRGGRYQVASRPLSVREFKAEVQS